MALLCVTLRNRVQRMTMIPPELRELAEPPADFVACAVPEHPGHNFLGHAHFSSKQNKTYWLLLGPLNEGVYTLKADYVRAQGRLGLAAASSVFVASFAEWRDVVAFWRKFCFHRHRKCHSHPMACVRGCPTHERQVVEDPRPEPKIKKVIVVKREATVKKEASVSAGAAKQEPLTPTVKQEPAGTAPKRKAEMQSPGTAPSTPVKNASRRAPHVRKAPTLFYTGSSDDDARSVDSDFFFLPDSPSPSAGHSEAVEAMRGPSPAAAVADVQAQPPVVADVLASRATSPTVSTASSLSASSLAASKGNAKGKGRAISHVPVEAPSLRTEAPSAVAMDGRTNEASATRGATARTNEPSASGISRAGPSAVITREPAATSSISHAGPFTVIAGPSAPASSISRVGRDAGGSRSRGPSRAGIFYVSARGAVHHSRDRAFSDIEAGPIQPVVGYDAAMTYADTLVLGGNGTTSEEGMDLDL
ncbi:hypothetical protein C8F04DRAFT_1192250 [Mycena alexandri]|uniref:Uncharacterized protein n=1 Tax=Mycena alexandri TaxID=1745969 RepID=A0AAD6WV24_9AGAR|nr:hypothetical protein C8F04DRAFT_1192250 [Mycena alexandri]